MTKEIAIDVHGLTKKFGDRTVVHDLSLQVPTGEIYGFLGPNGSGKTTTLRLLCGLLTPDAGEGTCLGYNILTQQDEIRRHVGYMTQRFSLYTDLSIRENLEFVARVYGVPKPRQAAKEAISRLGLTGRADQLAGDSTLLGIERQMRGILNTAPTGLTGSYNALSQIGIKTDRDTGQLALNSSEFTEALDTDFAAVAELFANDNQGYAFRFDLLVDSMLDDAGLIDNRVDGLNTRVRRLETDQAELERRLDLREVALRRQYAALDQLVGSLQSTSTFLLQNFSI